MAYIKTTWKNKIVERPKTFRQQQNADGTVTLIPTEGNIIEPGTPVNAQNMNKIEDALGSTDRKIDDFKNTKGKPDGIAALDASGDLVQTGGIKKRSLLISSTKGSKSIALDNFSFKEYSTANFEFITSTSGVTTGQINIYVNNTWVKNIDLDKRGYRKRYHLVIENPYLLWAESDTDITTYLSILYYNRQKINTSDTISAKIELSGDNIGFEKYEVWGG